MTILQPVLLGYASWGPIWLAQGGAEWVIDDSDDDGDPFADREGDDEDDDGDEPEEEQRPKSRKRTRQAEPDEPDEEETDEQDDEWIPPTRGDWEKLRDALKRNNAQNARLRHTEKTLKRLNITDLGEFLAQHGIDPTSGQKLADELEDGAPEGEDEATPATPATTATKTKTTTAQDRARRALELQRAADRASAEAEALYKPALVTTAARAAFMDAGWASKDFGLAMRLLDLDEIGVDFGETGEAELIGLEEQIERVKKSFPALFRKRRTPEQEERDDELTTRRRRRTSARDIDGGDRGRQDGKPQNWLDKVNRQLG